MKHLWNRPFSVGAVALAIMLLSLSPIVVHAQQTPTESTAEDVQGLDKLPCREIMLMAGIDRDTTIAFMHGYLAHKRGDNIVDVDRIESSTSDFLTACVDTPNASALSTLETAFGK